MKVVDGYLDSGMLKTQMSRKRVAVMWLWGIRNYG